MGRVYLVAAEPSGDLLASEIVTRLRETAPGTEIFGIGGEHLAETGISSPIDISILSIVGLVEGLKIYKRVVALADEAADDIIRTNPDVVGLVDSWGFTIRVAERVRRRAPHIKQVKIVGPQVWAMRPGRARPLAKAVDHLVCIHAFEQPFYEPFGLPTTVMGNPALSRGHPGDGAAGRRALGLSDEARTLLVLPGSRRAEIEQVAPVLLNAAKSVKAKVHDVQIVVHPASNVRNQLLAAFPDIHDWAHVTPQGADRFDIMAGADYALACSGTVTSELALQGTPFLVGYHTGWITWAIARFLLFKPDHITLLNIAAEDTEIVPEFVQTKFRADAMARMAIEMLGDELARKEQVAAQNLALSRMGESKLHSADVAASVLLEYT